VPDSPASGLATLALILRTLFIFPSQGQIIPISSLSRHHSNLCCFYVHGFPGSSPWYPCSRVFTCCILGHSWSLKETWVPLPSWSTTAFFGWQPLWYPKGVFLALIYSALKGAWYDPFFSNLKGISDRTDGDRGCFISPCVWYSHSRVEFHQSKQGSSWKMWQCLLWSSRDSDHWHILYFLELSTHAWHLIMF
jgi:hypothetical protein